MQFFSIAMKINNVLQKDLRDSLLIVYVILPIMVLLSDKIKVDVQASFAHWLMELH